MKIYVDASTEFDAELDRIPHYQVYPDMKAWVGRNFAARDTRLLVVAESHYMPKGSEVHHDPVAWYFGVATSAEETGWIRTRGVLQNGIKSGWSDNRAQTIYRNIEAAVVASRLFADAPSSIYPEIAFMNFFQRPAERSGGSIKVSKEDRAMACNVFQDVVSAIKPTAIAFTSKKASNHAKAGGAKAFLDCQGIAHGFTPHPSSPWWNIPSKPHGDRTGRQRFIDFLGDVAPARRD